MHHHHEQSQLRLKCIVLGSAGAGKTSLLRRYIHGTFEGHHTGSSDELSRSNRAYYNRRRGRSTTSTLGADYYVKKVDHPSSIRNSRHHGDSSAASGKESDSVLVQLWDTAGKERLRPQRYAAQYDKKSNFYQFLSIRPSASPSNKNNYEHRYNNWGFLNGMAVEPDMNSKSEIINEERDEDTTHRTAPKRNNTNHKHGRPLHYHHHNLRQSLQRGYNEPMGDALFRNIDACMLVYDSTSSMSFLHLMQWHSEWVSRLNHWEQEEILANNQHSYNNTTGIETTKSRRKHIPFIVVANKIDLLEREREQSHRLQSSVGQQRRSVMGFRNGEYKGNELVYEYAAENTEASQSADQPTKNSNSSTTLNKSEANYPPKQRLTYSLRETLWSTDSAYLNALQLTEDQLPANRRMILLWCQRNGIPHVEASALDGRGVEEAFSSIIKVGVEELGMRQMEISESRKQSCESGGNNWERGAISSEEWGSGREEFPHQELARAPSEDSTVVIDAAAETNAVPESMMVQDVTESNNTKQNGNHVSNSVGNGTESPAHNNVDPSQYYFLYQPRQEENLDLFARYSPKDEQRCSLFNCWLPLTSYCHR